MASGATAKYALPKPLGTDPPNIPGDVGALADAIDAILVPYAQDLIANRPAVGKTGKLFTQTDGLVDTTWRDNGTAWRSLGSRIVPNATSDIGQIVRAVSGQTADLVQYQNNAGGIVARVDPNGLVAAITMGVGSGWVSGTQATIGATAAGTIPLLVEGTTSQTADLQQWWQTTAGPTVAGVTAGGQLYSRTISAQPASSSLVAKFQGASGQAANLTEWQNNSAQLMAYIDPSGSFRTDFGGTSQVAINTGFMSNVSLAVVTGGTGRVAAILQAVASQTADILQIKNSAGTVLSGVQSTGRPVSYAGLYADNSQNSGAPAVGWFQGAVTGTPTIVAQAAAGQTADMQQWRNSAGTVLTKIDSIGQLVGPYATITTGLSVQRIQGQRYDASISNNSSGTFTIQAATGAYGNWNRGVPIELVVNARNIAGAWQPAAAKYLFHVYREGASATVSNPTGPYAAVGSGPFTGTSGVGTGINISASTTDGTTVTFTITNNYANGIEITASAYFYSTS